MTQRTILVKGQNDEMAFEALAMTPPWRSCDLMGIADSHYHHFEQGSSRAVETPSRAEGSRKVMDSPTVMVL